MNIEIQIFNGQDGYKALYYYCFTPGSIDPRG